MQELAIILLIAPMILFVARFIIKKSEVNWLTFITAICGICAVLVDETVDDQTMVIAIMPLFLITMFSALDVMRLVGGKRR